MLPFETVPLISISTYVFIKKYMSKVLDLLESSDGESEIERSNRKARETNQAERVMRRLRKCSVGRRF